MDKIFIPKKLCSLCDYIKHWVKNQEVYFCHSILSVTIPFIILLAYIHLICEMKFCIVEIWLHNMEGLSMKLSCFYKVREQFKKHVEFNSVHTYWADTLVLGDKKRWRVRHASHKGSNDFLDKTNSRLGHMRNPFLKNSPRSFIWMEVDMESFTGSKLSFSYLLGKLV